MKPRNFVDFYEWDMEDINPMSDRYYSEKREMKLLTVDELGQRLGMTKGALYNLVYTRQIPFVKIGRRVRFSEDDIMKWLEEKKVAPREI